jgi:hypothetical protein
MHMMATGDGPQVRLQINYSEKDLLHGYRLHFKRTLRLSLTILISVLSIGLGVFYLGLDRQLQVGYLLLIIPIVLIGILLFIFTVFPRILYKRDGKYDDPYIITFGENGIDFEKKGASTRIDWPAYTKVHQDRNAYILYYGKNDFTIIPRRVFQGSEEEAVFRRLLAVKSLVPY